MTAIAILKKKEILERVANGDKIADIGKDYGVTPSTISKQLSNDPEWKEARMIGSIARIEFWEKEVEKITPETNQIMLGRAKEMLSQARWRAEREFPGLYGGAKVNINVTGNVTMSEALGEEAGKLLDCLVEESKEEKEIS